MRDARLVGVTDDRSALVIEHEGRHVRLPLDAELRAAVTGELQLPMPLEPPLSPREVQRRLRGGETVAAIAAATGMSIERVVRFEGPVLAERRWHADQVRRREVDGVRLDLRLATVAAHGDESEATWDAWLDDDGRWRVRAEVPDGRSATWSWDPRSGRLRGVDDLAWLAMSGEAVRDDLDAVLRPIAASRAQQRPLSAVPPASVDEPVIDEQPPVPDEPPVAAEQPVAAEPPAVQDPADDDEPAEPDDAATTAPPVAAERSAPAKSRRAPVPSWDDIMLGSVRRRED